MAKKKTTRIPVPKAEPEIIVEQIGSGMTAGTRTTYRLDRGAGIEELRGVLRQPPIRFFDNLEQVLRTFLREEGCPDSPWAALKMLEKEERRSMRWYAAVVLRELVKRSRALKAGNAYLATLAAYRAGMLNQEARDKYEHEDTWTIGKNRRRTQSDVAKKGADKRRAEAEKKWAPIRVEAEKIRHRRDVKGRSLARIVKKKMKLTDPEETIRKKI